MRYKKSVTRTLSLFLSVTFLLAFLALLGNQFIPDNSDAFFHTISNLENFMFIMGGRKGACRSTLNKKPDLVILVHSAPQNRYRRDVIRKTWTTTPGSKTVFLVGLNSEFQNTFNEEQNEHGDLVQGNFIDSYKNLTYKHLMGLAWVVTFCSMPRAILKVDDDVFVDSYRVFDQLASFVDLKNTLACAVIPSGSSPIRNGPRSVSKEEYRLGRTYPTYCSGMAYLTSSEVAEKLVTQSRKETFFWVDDVYVTGTLADKSGVLHDNWIHWYSDEFSRDVLSWLQDKSDRKSPPYMFIELRESKVDWVRIMERLWSKTKRSWNVVDV